MRENQTEYFECSCFHSEHTFRLHFNLEEKEVYLDIFLANRGFFRRLVDGVKYIFGYKSRFGHFDEVILKTEDVARIGMLCDQFIDQTTGQLSTDEQRRIFEQWEARVKAKLGAQGDSQAEDK